MVWKTIYEGNKPCEEGSNSYCACTPIIYIVTLTVPSVGLCLYTCCLFSLTAPWKGWMQWQLLGLRASQTSTNSPSGFRNHVWIRMTPATQICSICLRWVAKCNTNSPSGFRNPVWIPMTPATQICSTCLRWVPHVTLTLKVDSGIPSGSQWPQQCRSALHA